MKIYVIGATAARFSGSFRLTRTPRSHRSLRSGQVAVDLTERDSIQRMFDQIGTVDAIISCTGSVPFKPLGELTDKDFRAGFEDQVLARSTWYRSALATPPTAAPSH